MRVLKLILEIWYLILPAAVFIGGLIYRKITHQPFKGEIPAGPPEQRYGPQ